MGELKVKVFQVYKPAGLSAVEMLGLAEIREVFMVSEYLYWERGSSKVMAPRLQGVDDSEEFSVVDVVVSFSWEEGVRQVGAGVPVSVFICLEEYASRGEFGCVCCNGERGTRVWYS